MNELQFINLLRKKSKPIKDVLCGIGDDCALVRIGKEKILLKSDLSVEGVHFKKKDTSYKDIAKRAVARVLSDFAACGGVAKFIGISLGKPKNVHDRALGDMLAGVNEMGAKFKFSLVGGDTSVSSKLILDVWGVGVAKKFISRGGAKRGDVIFLSGPLGKRPFSKSFEPRVNEAQYLVDNFKVNSMIDISDGFIIDLYRLLKESKKGACILHGAIPCTKDDSDMYRGEDYELLFTVSKDEPKINDLMRKFYCVGTIEGQSFGYKIKIGKKLKKALVRGYTHF